MNTFKNRLAEINKRYERENNCKMSYRDLAEATNTSKTTVSRWMNNDVTSFDADVLAAFCDFYGCSVEELLVKTGKS